MTCLSLPAGKPAVGAGALFLHCLICKMERRLPSPQMLVRTKKCVENRPAPQVKKLCPQAPGRLLSPLLVLRALPSKNSDHHFKITEPGYQGIKEASKMHIQIHQMREPCFSTIVTFHQGWKKGCESPESALRMTVQGLCMLKTVRTGLSPFVPPTARCGNDLQEERRVRHGGTDFCAQNPCKVGHT